MTEELIEKADKLSFSYNKKYSEDYKLKDMLSRPKDFVEGAIEGVIHLLRQKAWRDGYIAGATEATKELQEKIWKLEGQITKWREDYICLENLKDNQIQELQEKNKQLEELLAEQYPDLKQSLDWANEREKELLEQIEKMKNCSNCENWNWKHNRCEKKLKGDCFKASKWKLREN